MVVSMRWKLSPGARKAGAPFASGRCTTDLPAVTSNTRCALLPPAIAVASVEKATDSFAVRSRRRFANLARLGGFFQSLARGLRLLLQTLELGVEP
jgi:hypothetical protein